LRLFRKLIWEINFQKKEGVKVTNLFLLRSATLPHERQRGALVRDPDHIVSRFAVSVLW
jgi:hypothetical protein